MSTSTLTWRPKKDPWLPPDHDEASIYAVRALANGTANDGQQKTAWAYIMYLTGAGGGYLDMPYRPGGQDAERDTSFALGKFFVGHQLQKLLLPEFNPQGHIREPQPDLPKTVRRTRSKRTK